MSESVVLSVPSLVMPGTDDTFVQYLDASKTVPVIVEVFSNESLASRELAPILVSEVRRRAGSVLLVRVDATTEREVVAALQVRSIPTVVALIGGQLAPLFEGAQAAATVATVVDKLVEAASANGITGRVESSDPADANFADGDDLDDSDEPQRSPLSEEAYQAMTRGEYDVATETYGRALEANPADLDAKSGLAQIALVTRLKGKTLPDIRGAAANNPGSVVAALDVADLDLSGGHVEDACDRLLTLFVTADADERKVLRERLLEYFVIVGDSDPRTLAARSRLASLLY